MGEVMPCRVQWVTRPDRMHAVIETLTAAGATMVARRGYDVTTEDLDLVADAETGRLSIAEFRLDPSELRRQVLDVTNQLTPAETLLIDLSGPRAKIQVLPVPGDYGVIVRRCDGLRRFPRSGNGFRRDSSRWLANQLAQNGYA